MVCNRLILCDFDNTLFDTENLRAAQFQRALGATGNRIRTEQFSTAYDSWKTNGYLDLKKIAAYFGTNFHISEEDSKNIFLEVPFHEYLFPEAIPLLRGIKDDVYVYTLGDPDGYQIAKIRGSGILSVIDESRIILRQDKDTDVSKLLGILKEQGYQKFLIIDDKAGVLDRAIEAADRLGIQLEAIRMAYGKHGNEPMLHPEGVTVVRNLTQLRGYIGDTGSEGKPLHHNSESFA